MARTDDLMEQAPLVFEGTVVRLAASTLAALAATDRTIVMRVDTFIRVPDALRGYAGQEITVELRPRTTTNENEQAICYAEGLMYGEGLAVRELGWQRVSATSARARAQLDQVVAAEPERRLKRRVDSADLVVTGRVTSTAPVPRGPNPPISEHYPDWHLATVDVEGVEKGEQAPGQVRVKYAASEDVAWYRAPKLHEGDQRVFLLHRGDQVVESGPHADAIATDDFVVVDPLDVQPIDERGRIQALVNQ